jgi:CBS domain containing-hemolysin-like protein
VNWEQLFAIGLQAFAVLALAALNGFFVAAEFALVKVRDTQLEPLIAQGRGSARMVRNLLQHLDAYLSACQVGITLASLGLGWVGKPIFNDLLAPVFQWLEVSDPDLRDRVAFVVGFSFITFLHITAGEMAPKSLSIARPLPVALVIAYPLRWFHFALYPVIWVLNESSLWMLRRIGIEPAAGHEGAHSADELRLMFMESHQRSGSTALGRDIVLNALDLRQRVARDVMRPRQEIAMLDSEASIADCLDTAERTRYSRFPLCEGGDVDRTLGVVHIKDLYALRTSAARGADLAGVAKKLVFVPETARLERLLQVFLERKLHLALVVDEYGGTTGLVTLENILEELVGPIQDEFDSEQPLLVPHRDGVWDVDGALPLHELAELVGEPLQGEGVTTTSGWVTQRLGGFPKPGDVLPLARHDLRVEAMNGPRVARLRLARRAEAS